MEQLVRRLVKNDQMSRLSVYQRHDGLFQYLEEEISEWDDAPPAWIEVGRSGIFMNSQEAVVEARAAIQWLRSSVTGEMAQLKRDNLQRDWRTLGTHEMRIMERLIRIDFQAGTQLPLSCKRRWSDA